MQRCGDGESEGAMHQTTTAVIHWLTQRQAVKEKLYLFKAEVLMPSTRVRTRTFGQV